MKINISKKINTFYFICHQNRKTQRGNFFRNLINKHLDIFFFENNTWKNLSKNISQKQFQWFYNYFKSFYTKREKEWTKDQQQLTQWKKYLNHNQKIIKKIVNIEKTLTNVKTFNLENIPIFLVLKYNQRDLSAWYSYSENSTFIVLEIPINQYPDNNNLFPCAVLLHEIFHLLIRKNKILKKQIYNLNKNSPYFEELLISSFIPEGYLSQVYLNTPQLKYSKNSKNLIDQRRYIAHKLSDQAQTYIKKKQPLDKKYFNLIKSTI